MTISRRVYGTQHHKTALAGTKCNTCSLLHCLVHAATNHLCIETSSDTYSSAQHATFKPRTQKLPLRNTIFIGVMWMMWQRDKTTPASPHPLNTPCFSSDRGPKVVRPFALVVFKDEKMFH